MRQSKTVIQHDFESLTVILSVAMVVAILSLMSSLSSWEGSRAPVSTVEGYSIPAHLRGSAADAPTLTPDQAAQQAFRGALNEPQSEAERIVLERFQQAIALLHAKRYEYAITALDAVLALAPEMPEAYVNMGYAFLGLEEFGPAEGAFQKALELKVDQVNAYYGLAVAYEGQKDVLFVCSDHASFLGAPRRELSFELETVKGYSGFMGLEYIRDFADAVLNDRDPAVSGRDGLKALEVVEAIYKSAVERCWTPVD